MHTQIRTFLVILILNIINQYQCKLDANVLMTPFGELNRNDLEIEKSILEVDPKCAELKYNITTYRYNGQTFEDKSLLMEENIVDVDDISGSFDYKLKLYKRPFLNCLKQDDQTLIDYIKDNMIEAPSGEPLNLMEPLEQNINGEVGQPLDADRIVFGGELKNGFFLEAGAHDGEFNSDSLYFEANHNWTGLLVEPVPGAYEFLKLRNRNASTIQTCLAVEKHPQYVNFDYLAALREGSERSSMAGIATEDRNDDLQMEMQCMPLYSVLMAMGNPTVNYFSLDVEGAEFTILMTIPWDKVDIQVMSIESHLLGYVFPGVREEMIEYLDKVGYRHIPWGHTATNNLRGSYSDDEEENQGTNDDLFVRKDIPLKLTQAEKEEIDGREEGRWKVKNPNLSTTKAIELLRERHEAKLAKEKREREEL